MQDGQWSQVERFLDHLRLERRLSQHTIKSYRRDLTALAEFCNRETVATWSELQGFHVRRFAALSHGAGLSPRSIQRRLSGVRSFLNYLVREDLLPGNPATEVSAPRPPKRLPGTLDADQMARLLDIRGEDPVTVRDLAMMELLYSSGLRLAELVSLNIGDLDLQEATVSVTGKGNKQRILPVGRHAAQAVRHWLKRRVELAPADAEALFIGVRGRRINPRTVQSRVDHWARTAGLSQRVYPHLFRHSFATHLLESSGDLRGVQELLGHADISTTQIYTHLDFQHLAHIYDKAHPRARKRN